MKSYRRILLATDFSPAARNALAHAAVLTQRSGAELHALHVNIVPAVLPVTEADMPDAEAYSAALAQACQGQLDSLPFSTDLKVSNAVRSDYSPTQGILAYAAEINADLIIMGTHGRTGLMHALMGSVAAQVVRTATVPVLVAGPGKGHELGGDGIDCIVTATDFSEASKPGVRHAAALAAEHNAQLHLVHAVPLPLAALYNMDTSTTASDLENGRKALSAFVSELGLGSDVTLEAVVGEAYDVINAAAQREGADLLVISAQGHSAIERLLIGSVAEKVARTAPCPVLVHRPAAD